MKLLLTIPSVLPQNNQRRKGEGDVTDFMIFHHTVNLPSFSCAFDKIAHVISSVINQQRPRECVVVLTVVS